jgi:hypothetical protein
VSAVERQHSGVTFRLREAALVEDHYARWILEHAGLRGHEVHDDGDAVWQTTDRGAWGNAGTRFRFREADVDERLEQITSRFTELKRPAGFWLSAFSTPATLPAELRRLGFRWRKRVPGMHCDLRRLRRVARVAGLRFERGTDHARFAREPHPSIGRITTPLRRMQLRNQILCRRAGLKRTGQHPWIAPQQGREPGGACAKDDGPYRKE